MSIHCGVVAERRLHGVDTPSIRRWLLKFCDDFLLRCCWCAMMVQNGDCKCSIVDNPPRAGWGRWWHGVDGRHVRGKAAHGSTNARRCIHVSDILLTLAGISGA